MKCMAFMTGDSARRLYRVAMFCVLAAFGLAGRNASAATAPDASACPESGVLEAADSDYGKTVIKTISSQTFYFKEAADAGQTGVVALCFEITPHGRIRHILMEQPTGFPLLDGAALYAAGLVAAVDTGRMTVPTWRPNASLRPRLLPTPPTSLFDGRDSVWMRFKFSFGSADIASKAIPQAGENTIDRKVCRPLADTTDDDTQSAFPPDETIKLDPAFTTKLGTAVSVQLPYPKEALAAGIVGVSRIRMAFTSDASLVCTAIQQTSGEAILDGAALIGVGIAGARKSFPALPDKFLAGRSPIAFFELPVNYKLR